MLQIVPSLAKLLFLMVLSEIQFICLQAPNFSLNFDCFVCSQQLEADQQAEEAQGSGRAFSLSLLASLDVLPSLPELLPVVQLQQVGASVYGAP